LKKKVPNNAFKKEKRRKKVGFKINRADGHPGEMDEGIFFGPTDCTYPLRGLNVESI